MPFRFILDELSHLDPLVRPMFGAHALYVGSKIVLILREKPVDPTGDNGVWLATTSEHHESLQKDFPSMRSIRLFDSKGPTGWQNIPSTSAHFEDEAILACALISKGDPRIGKEPKRRSSRSKH